VSPRLVLVGAPGAGKSTIGRQVAARLDLAFTDTDRLVEDAAGMSVSDIFVTMGEDQFRRLEEEAIELALRESEGVVALGGGSVLSEATRSRLASHFVVWLKVDLSDATSRVGMNTARPLLLGNVRGRLAALMRQREGWYEQVSSATIETSGKAPGGVVAEVLALPGLDHSEGES
jgi:shikimate kinase